MLEIIHIVLEAVQIVLCFEIIGILVSKNSSNR